MKSPTRLLALLRAINVGGKNIIAKADLIAAFEDLGFENVRTYIQSGNVIFDSHAFSRTSLTRKIQSELSRRFGYQAQVVVQTSVDYREALQAAHASWGDRIGWKHNALFTLKKLDPARIVRDLPVVLGQIEEISIGPGVIFWSVSAKAEPRSTMAKLVKSPWYRKLTVRNHNTTRRLLELLDE